MARSPRLMAYVPTSSPDSRASAPVSTLAAVSPPASPVTVNARSSVSPYARSGSSTAISSTTAATARVTVTV